jgi:hypothetical protein
MRILSAAFIIFVTVGGPGVAQQAPSPGECAEGVAEAATPPEAGDATAPGNAATGWSGGLGGSQTGTNPQGAVAESKTWQPPTARGLDLVGAPEPAAC